MKKFALVAIILFIPLQTWAVCSVNGYTVIYVNGIFTTAEQAKVEKKLLEDTYEDATGRSDVVFLSGYNPTHLGGAGDLVKAVQQAYRDEGAYINDYDLQTILRKIEPDVKTRKILLFGYSQGTFYTNALYKYLVENGVPKESIAVYNVGTPASFVAGNGHYLTSANDMLINKVREATAFGAAKVPLPANILIAPVEEIPAPSYPGHSLKNVYLPKATVKIIGDIDGALQNLIATQPSEGSCFTPPPATAEYQLKGAGFAIFDPAAEGLKTGTAYAYKGAKLVVGVAQGGLNALGNAVRSLLPKADTATAIEAFDVVRNVYGSSVSKEDLLELNASVPSVQKKHKTEDLQVLPYMITPAGPETASQNDIHTARGEVLGEFIENPPAPPILFMPFSTNGPLIGGGGGGTPSPEPAPQEQTIEPSSEPEPTPSAPAPVSELSVNAPEDNETFATTTITVSGTAPAETRVEVSDGTITAVTSSDLAGAWNTELTVAEGPVTLTVSAFETALNATTTLSRSLTVTLPCTEPAAISLGEDISETWTSAHNPYIIDGSVYVRDGLLSIGPGTIVKFKPGASLEMHADVAFTVNGMQSDPVIFTSLYDDAAGGDTNCDGASTVPMPGDWGYVSLGGGSWNSNMSIAHLHARYGGGLDYRGVSPILAINYPRFSGASGRSYSLQTLDVSESAHTGLYLYISAFNSVSLSNSSFRDNENYGVYRDTSISPFPGTLTAANNWWNNVTGPFHDTLNATGTGDALGSIWTDGLILSPWLSGSPW